jgi:hypothetical protein
MITKIRLPKFEHTKERKAKFSPFFKVNEVPLLREDTKNKIDYRVLINAETDKQVGLVSDRYNLTTHKSASDLVKGILTKAGLEYQSLGAQTSNGGSRFYETLVFPSLAFNPETPDVPSTAFDALGGGHVKVEEHFPAITIRNSYDKTSPVIFGYGMYRLVCTNGLVLPIKETKLSFKHTQEVDTQKVKDVLLQNLEQSTKLMDVLYKKLNGMGGTEFLCKILTDSFTNKFKKALLDKLNAQDKTIHVDYEDETDPETGKVLALRIKNIETKASAYAIYNVVTDVATHTLTNRAEREVANTKIAKAFMN